MKERGWNRTGARTCDECGLGGQGLDDLAEDQGLAGPRAPRQEKTFAVESQLDSVLLAL